MLSIPSAPIAMLGVVILATFMAAVLMAVAEHLDRRRLIREIRSRGRAVQMTQCPLCKGCFGTLVSEGGGEYPEGTLVERAPGGGESRGVAP